MNDDNENTAAEFEDSVLENCPDDLSEEDKEFLMAVVAKEIFTPRDSSNEGEYRCIQECEICDSEFKRNIPLDFNNIDLRDHENDLSFTLEKRKRLIKICAHEFFKSWWTPEKEKKNLKPNINQNNLSTIQSGPQVDLHNDFSFQEEQTKRQTERTINKNPKNELKEFEKMERQSKFCIKDPNKQLNAKSKNKNVNTVNNSNVINKKFDDIAQSIILEKDDDIFLYGTSQEICSTNKESYFKIVDEQQINKDINVETDKSVGTSGKPILDQEQHNGSCIKLDSTRNSKQTKSKNRSLRYEKQQHFDENVNSESLIHVESHNNNKEKGNAFNEKVCMPSKEIFSQKEKKSAQRSDKEKIELLNNLWRKYKTNKLKKIEEHKNKPHRSNNIHAIQRIASKIREGNDAVKLMNVSTDGIPILDKEQHCFSCVKPDSTSRNYNQKESKNIGLTFVASKEIIIDKTDLSKNHSGTQVSQVKDLSMQRERDKHQTNSTINKNSKNALKECEWIETQSKIAMQKPKRPLHDKDSPFFIDEELFEMYQDGLSASKWNPTQVLHEICSQSQWIKPEYIQVGFIVNKGFQFSVKLQGLNFVSQDCATTKKEAKHLASVECLKFMGFDFSYKPHQILHPSNYVPNYNKSYKKPRYY